MSRPDYIYYVLLPCELKTVPLKLGEGYFILNQITPYAAYRYVMLHNGKGYIVREANGYTLSTNRLKQIAKVLKNRNHAYKDRHI